MTDKENVNEEEQQDDEVAPGIGTTSATKRVGRSGREDDGPDVVELGKYTTGRAPALRREVGYPVNASWRPAVGGAGAASGTAMSP